MIRLSASSHARRDQIDKSLWNIALLKHRRRQDMDDGDRREYPRHDQEHNERGGIQESHRRLYHLRAMHLRTKRLRPTSWPLLLPRADSFSHYTLDTIIGNACPHGLASEICKENAARIKVSRDTVPRYSQQARSRPAVFCVIVTSSE
jgi:hypothetical protein